MIEPLVLKKNDLQPYYFFHVTDDGGDVNLTDCTIYCTMKNVRTGVAKINRQTIGITLLNTLEGKGCYKWQAGETDTAGKYQIEFEINPLEGGKFTTPPDGSAIVRILE